MNQLRTSWRHRTNIWKLRFRFFWLRLHHARARRIYSRVLDRSVTVLDTFLRLHFDLPLATDNDAIDQAIRSAVSEFLFLKSSDCDDTESYRKFIDHLQRDSESLAVLRVLLEVRIWVYASLNADALPERAVQASARYSDVFGGKAPSLNLRAARRVGKVLKTVHRMLRRKLVTNRTRKIDLGTHLNRTAIVSWTIFLVPSAITIYGYVYAVIFFHHFGLDTSLFFSIGDYIAFSLNKLGILVFCLLGSAVGSLMAMSRSSGLSRVSFNREHQETVTAFKFLVVSLCLLTLVGYWLSPVLFFLALTFWTVTLSLGERLCDAVMTRYFEPVPALSRAAGLFLTCLLVVTCTAKVDAHSVALGDPRAFSVQTTSERLDNTSHKLIGATSDFIFLLDDKGAVDIVAKTTVRNIGLPHQGPGLLFQLRNWMLNKMPAQFDPNRAEHRSED